MKNVKIAHWGGRHIMYLPLHVADRLGLFAAQNLKVTLYPAGNDNDVFDEVTSGRAHFGVGDPTFAAIGRKKHNARVIAAVAVNASTWGITHHPEIKPFAQASDFVGLRVGTFPKPATTTAMLEVLRKRQLRLLKSMEIIEAEIDQQSYLLASGRVDMIIESEPMISNSLHQGMHLVCGMHHFYPEFLFTGLTTLASTIEASPEIVGKIVLALQQALTICRTQTDKAVAVARELFPAIGPSVMSDAVQRMIDTGAWPEKAIIAPQAWMNALKLRQDMGEISKLPPFETIVDQRFAYAALEKL